MKTEQLNIFGTKRLEFNDAIELTIASIMEYGSRHDHWAFAYSMGKDSTTLVTLIIQLIQTGQIPKPKSLTVLCADTRQELIPLWYAALGIIEKLKQLGIEVKIVTASLDNRFLVYILGRGIPPPSNTFRWCTGKIKVEPMESALTDLWFSINEGKSCCLENKQDQDITKILMFTGVRLGESAVRDGRIATSCSKDGAECGQGWYQNDLNGKMCATLAPIIHWRVCGVWDWLKIFAPSKKYGEWPTAILADAYGGDEAEEINARTGCVACPLVEKDKALTAIIKIKEWAYLQPLLELKAIYREMRKPQHRLRQNGEKLKNGSLSSNPQRLGPLTLKARLFFLEQILSIQTRINTHAVKIDRPVIDILNQIETSRIRELLTLNTFPNGWKGTEITGDVMIDKINSDGSVMPLLFNNNDF